MIFSFKSFSSKKRETICPESRKRLTTQCKFCLMDVECGHQTSGIGLNAAPTDKGGGWSKIGKILWTSFMDGPLTVSSNNDIIT